MDRRVMDYFERKMMPDERRGRRRDYEDERDYEDGRRGVKGSGRRRDRADYDDYEPDNRRGRDRRDYDDEDYRDYDDYGSHLKLTKSDIHRWKKKLENADGTRGEHYDMQQVMQVADKIDVRFKDYSEKEFCLLTNVMYSDYGHVIKKCVGPEKELMMCAEMAKAFLEDPDGPEPSEKLALYYHCIACADEV